MRGKRHHFVKPDADETRDGAAGHDKVQSVLRINRSASAAEDFAAGRRGYVGGRRSNLLPPPNWGSAAAPAVRP